MSPASPEKYTADGRRPVQRATVSVGVAVAAMVVVDATAGTVVVVAGVVEADAAVVVATFVVVEAVALDVLLLQAENRTSERHAATAGVHERVRIAKV